MKKYSFTVLLLFIALLSACGNSSTKSSKSEDEVSGAKIGFEGDKLVVVDHGGALTDARVDTIFKPFEEKFGVEVIVESPVDYGKFKSMVDSGNVEWDVVNADGDFVIRGEKAGLLEKMDLSIIDTDGIRPEFVHDYGIGAELYSLSIGYNTDAFSKGEHPASWADFWNTEKFPGGRSLWKEPRATLEAALLADGVSKDELYPLDVDRAFKSLDKIKSNVSVWWTTGAEAPQLLAGGEVDLAGAYNGRIVTAKNEGALQDVDYNESIVLHAAWVVPKGSKNKDLAMEFINFAASPEIQAAFSSQIPYAPVNEKALELMEEDQVKELGQSGENLENQVQLDYQWWVDNYDEVNERFQAWLLK